MKGPSHRANRWLRLSVDVLEEAGKNADVLISSVGHSLYFPIETITEEEICAQMETNVLRTPLSHSRRPPLPAQSASLAALLTPGAVLLWKPKAASVLMLLQGRP